MVSLTRIAQLLLFPLVVTTFAVTVTACGGDSSTSSKKRSTSTTSTAKSAPSAEETAYAEQLSTANDSLRVTTEGLNAASNPQQYADAAKALTTSIDAFFDIQAPSKYAEDHAQLKSTLRRAKVSAGTITASSTEEGDQQVLIVITRELKDGDERISDLFDELGYQDA